jgi:hypothetical protein
MPIGEPTMPTAEEQKLTPEEQAKLEKSRALSDAELLKGGAEYVVDENGEKRLEVTKDQPYELRKRKKLEEASVEFVNEAGSLLRKALDDVDFANIDFIMRGLYDDERANELSRKQLDFLAVIKYLWNKSGLAKNLLHDSKCKYCFVGAIYLGGDKELASRIENRDVTEEDFTTAGLLKGNSLHLWEVKWGKLD